MSIESGTVIVLTYLLVSIGVIVVFVGAVLMVGWFIGRRRERRGRAGLTLWSVRLPPQSVDALHSHF
jgi:hypothetical protein